jgi:hypothetical protein
MILATFSSWFRTATAMASNAASSAPPAEPVVFPPPRAALDAIWPVLTYLPLLSHIPRLFSPKGLPKGYAPSQRILLPHIVLTLFESARYHLASLRYNVPNSPLWTAADTPPLPTLFDLALVLTNNLFVIWLSKRSRLGNPKIVRTIFQAWALIRSVVTPLALLAARRGHMLLASPGDNNTAATAAAAAAEAAAEQLVWAARLHGASSRILDIFATHRFGIHIMLVSNWYTSFNDQFTWGNMLGTVVSAQACGLPGAFLWLLGLMCALNAVEDWVGRVVKAR